MRRTVLLLVLCTFAIMLMGCGQRQSTQTSRPTIAVIPKGTTHEFWRTVHAGAEKAGREMDVDVIWKGPLREDDRDAQIAVVEDFTSRGVSGIVLAPSDESALRAPVRDAVRSGIPVVIFDSGLNSDDHVSYVATDNGQGSRIAGEQMVKLMGGRGNVAVLRYAEGSQSTMQREAGFLEIVSKHRGMNVVSKNQYGGATTETAYKASENMIARFKLPDGKFGIDGIFCPNESTTFGMLRALQDSGLAGKVRFIGFDSSARTIDAIGEGEIDALVVQNPMQIGYMSVKTMVQHLRGQETQDRIDTGATLVTKDNLDNPDIRELLHPDLEKWLK